MGIKASLYEYLKISIEDIKAVSDYSEYLINHLDEEKITNFVEK